MKNFKVHGFQATLLAGLIQLADTQAVPRSAALELQRRLDEHKPKPDPKAKDQKEAMTAAEAAVKAALPKLGEYKITGAVNFKRLEEFGWDGKPTRLQESQQFSELRAANEVIARQDRERMEKAKKGRDTSSREPRAQRGNLR